MEMRRPDLTFVCESKGSVMVFSMGISISALMEAKENIIMPGKIFFVDWGKWGPDFQEYLSNLPSIINHQGLSFWNIATVCLKEKFKIAQNSNTVKVLKVIVKKNYRNCKVSNPNPKGNPQDST